MLKMKKLVLITCIATSTAVAMPIITSALPVGGKANVSESGITSALLKESSEEAAVEMKNRNEIAEKDKWKTEDLYATKGDWDTAFKVVKEELIPKIEKCKGTLNSPENLVSCLKLYEETANTLDKVYWYARLKADENGADNDAAEVADRAEGLYNDFSSGASFIQPELLKLPEESLKEYMIKPELKNYVHYIDAIAKQKAHTLSESEEKLLANASDIAGTGEDVFNKLSVADMKFPKIMDPHANEIQLSPGVYSSALDSQYREYRQRAFEGTYGAYDALKNSFAAALIGSVKKDVFFAKERKYKSALEASLSGDSIPTEVYSNLIKAVNDNTNSLHKYVELRKKYLKLDKVHVYDMYVPLVDNYEMKIPYEQGKKTILEGLKPLGNEYLEGLKKGFENRWVDVYETENKATGGYQIGIYGAHPYVLLNYNDTADSMLTAAHEMGHAMHSVYSQSNQPYMTSDTPIFNAEVASTANEIMMIKYLIKNAKNDDEKLYFINNLVEQIRGSVYTQVMYSEFEGIIHEKIENGEALSAKSLKVIWGDLMQKYYGPEFEVDDLSTLWWARISHFYNNFYVYKYATSLAASNEIVKNILDGKDPKAVDNYLDFLKSGSSNYPVEILKKAGVDPTKTTAVDNTLKEFGDLVNQMEEILIKQGKISK